MFRRVALGFMGIAIAVGCWSALTYSGLLSADTFPTPSATVAEFVALVQHGYGGVPLYEEVWTSLEQALIGFGLALVVGIPVGLATGYYRVVEGIASPLLSFFRPIPPIAYIPLAVLYFGIGNASKIALIFGGALFFLILNTQAGVKSVPQELIRAGSNAGVTGFSLFRRVIVPAAMPAIVTGMRTAMSIAWALVVAAELISSNVGLGYMIINSANFSQLTVILVGIALIGLFGFLMDASIELAGRRLLHWQGR